MSAPVPTSMSLLEGLLRKRRELRPSDTQVTTPGGLVFTERLASDGRPIASVPTRPVGSHGYVVDTEPDLEVAWVAPDLALGSQDVAQDLAILQDNSFTHVLSVGIEIPSLRRSPALENLYVELLDLPETRLADVLDSCFEFIDGARRHGKVFVHCNAGVSRSASVVLAYLMREGRTYAEAYAHVKRQRSAVRPNDGFVSQLTDLEEQYRYRCLEQSRLREPICVPEKL